MPSTRLLTLGPDSEPLWVPLYVHQTGETWAAMILGDDVRRGSRGAWMGLAFFSPTLKEAEHKAKA